MLLSAFLGLVLALDWTKHTQWRCGVDRSLASHFYADLHREEPQSSAGWTTRSPSTSTASKLDRSDIGWFACVPATTVGWQVLCKPSPPLYLGCLLRD
jgi:hypothetical protein